MFNLNQHVGNDVLGVPKKCTEPIAHVGNDAPTIVPQNGTKPISHTLACITRPQNGITLIALVITIIVLLILARGNN